MVRAIANNNHTNAHTQNTQRAFKLYHLQVTEVPYSKIGICDHEVDNDNKGNSD